MANVATAQLTIPISIGRTGSYNKVTPVLCTLDTAGSDLTVYTPGAGNYCGIVGVAYRHSAAHTFIVKGGATIILSIPFDGANGILKDINDGLLCSTFVKGSALIINFTTAVPANLTLYVAEYSSIQFNR